MKNVVKKIFLDESGSQALEYALILGLVGVAVVGALMSLGVSMEGMLGRVGDSVDAIEFE